MTDSPKTLQSPTAPLDIDANLERFDWHPEPELIGFRDEDASRYYGGLSEGRYDIAFLAPAQMRLAEIAERAGDRRTAALHYARAARLWAAADPALRPIAERAKRKAEEGQ